ncbi:restriction endonuclease subunit R [Helicobacter sp.]|uniref:restriction endonuclease subunit R n=1 Tax=Helicobacter sp. TaxID=218 RepID=UPI002A91F056|nr:restriction endonuclease subunit R [Helicobacter sp.]MDY5557360.1 restriction endonuclease subunit R [Helicobacter sp.]
MTQILQDILKIDESKECIKFLVKRVQSENYRGVQISQHNRYEQKEILIILQEIYNLCGENYLQIRTTDLSKRPQNINGEEIYAKLTHNIASKIGRCTQDSLRKNIFVDMHRMGLINRFNAKKKALSPFENGMKKYIALTPLAIELLSAKDIFTRNILYTRALESLMNGFGEEILQIALELNNPYLTIYELLFFGTFVYQTLDSHIYTREEIIEFIKEFRALSKFPQKLVMEKIKAYCNPSNFSGDKTHKRDFHNWINETQQILTLLAQMAYFEWNRKEQRLYIRVGRESVYANNVKLKRSLVQKQHYFTQHNVVKTKGFELHHVVPLCFAKTRNEFLILDDWQNLVYIDAYSHAQITQNNNANVRLSFDENDAIFTDFNDNSVCCKNNTNIKYDLSKQEIMFDYNQKLLGINS